MVRLSFDRSRVPQDRRLSPFSEATMRVLIGSTWHDNIDPEAVGDPNELAAAFGIPCETATWKADGTVLEPGDPIPTDTLVVELIEAT